MPCSQQSSTAEWVDLTLPAPGVRPGSLHPITQIQHEIEEVFTSMGFAVLDGPEVETEYNNFDALNIPPDHPARDMQDTFWLEGGHLLRTHTSPVQVRGMKKLGPPLRMIAPGRVFRNEEVDASHEHTFYQLEGMMVDRDVSVAHLIYFMKTLLSAVFKRDVTVRLRPGYFPFVEPGFELDIQCLICGGRAALSASRAAGWNCCRAVWCIRTCCAWAASILNSGTASLSDSGLTRLVMMRYAIDDIRLLQSGDLRFMQTILTNPMKFSYQLAQRTRRRAATRSRRRTARPHHASRRRSAKASSSSARHLADVCAARVIGASPIEGSKNVKAVVDTGRYGTKTVVCGAPNCRAGIVTAYVPAGTKIDGKEIRKAIDWRRGERRHARERRRAGHQSRFRAAFSN